MGAAIELYAAYQKRLKELNAADFGDLLLENIRLFQENPDVLRQYQRWFRYILVDEYQDTNVAQYLWLRLLAQGSHNICCVGDDDQSIYGWRGAEVDNILRFEKDFPGAQGDPAGAAIIAPPAHILGAASKLIANNQAGSARRCAPTQARASKLTCAASGTTRRKRALTGEDIEPLRREGMPLNDMAILVRASFQMRAFEDRFVTLGLPYRVIGGPRFYERQEIKDAIAYLEVMQNPADDLEIRAHRQCAQARPRRHDAAGDLHSYARAERLAACSHAARADRRDGGAEARGAQGARARSSTSFERWRALLDGDAAHRAGRADPR